MIIREVSTRLDEHAFLTLPWRIYRDDPHWIPPLLLMRGDSLSEKQPYFKHARWRRWLAWEGKEAIGGISAQVDALSLAHRRDATGYFGFLEAVDDAEVFRGLTAAAEQWLREQGLARVVGPLSLSINQECGLLIDGFDTPPNFLMGHGKRYYAPRLEEVGYQRAVTLLTYESPPDFPAPPVLTALQRRIAKRLVVRPLQDKVRDLALIRDIFNDAWANNWGFVPFTEDEFRAVGNEMLLITPKDLVQIAEVDGEPSAFIVMLPNLNEVIGDLNGRLLPLGWAKLLWRLKVRSPKSARVPLMGVRQKFQGTPLGPGLAFAVIDAVRKDAAARGVRNIELGWILEGNAGMNHIIQAIGGVMNKRYALYERSLVDERSVSTAGA